MQELSAVVTRDERELTALKSCRGSTTGFSLSRMESELRENRREAQEPRFVCSRSWNGEEAEDGERRLYHSSPEPVFALEARSMSLSSSSSEGQHMAARKWKPPRLEIPSPEPEEEEVAASFLESMESLHAQETELSHCYGVCSKKGRRPLLEDYYHAMPTTGGGDQPAFFGVYDGHGGKQAAEFAVQCLGKNILDSMQTAGCSILGNMDAVKEGFLVTDGEFLQKDVPSGTCCVTAIIKNGTLFVGNAGDCRAVLSRGGVAEVLTTDHRASREDERLRIEDLGGYVGERCGSWRVQNSLSVTRAIGDKYLKEYIIAEPEVCTTELSSECEFLVLASDGLWEVVSNQEVVDVVKTVLSESSSTSNSSDQKSSESLSGLSVTSLPTPRRKKKQVCKSKKKYSKGGRREAKDCLSPRKTLRSPTKSASIEGKANLDSSWEERGSRKRSKGPKLGTWQSACNRLVDLACERGSQDDVTVLIVPLEPYMYPMQNA